MVGKSNWGAVFAVLIGVASAAAQDQKTPELPTAVTPAAAPANSGLQREYARLAQLLNSDDTFGRGDAAETFLRVRPSDVTNPDTRKLIARGYRSLALDGRGGSQDEAIQGLVIWAGKYSVPVLIELLEKDRHPSDEIFTALGKLKDLRGAEVVARHLGNFFTHDAAFSALRNMGPAAEDALIEVAPSSDPKTSMAAVQLLGDVGTEKSMKLLQRAAASKNFQIKQVARDAVKRIRQRQRDGGSADEPETVDPNSPFAEGAGPAVDITARNSRDFGSRMPRMPRGAGGGNFGDDDAEVDAEEEPVEDLDEGEWSQVNALLPGDPLGKGVPADPATDAVDPSWRPQPTRLGKTVSNHERAAGFDIAGGGSPIAVVIYNDPFNETIGRMEIANLKQRRSLGSHNILGGAKSCALSPKATRILVVGEEGFHDRKARLDIWGLSGGKATELATWWPYATSDHWQNQMAWAEWIDEEQFFTMNGQGMLVLWRLDGKKPTAVYQIDGESGSQPTLSPGRKHLAMATQRGVEIFRAADGELLARMGEVTPRQGSLAFSENGGQLACVTGKSIYVWNATDGKLQRDFDCNDLHSGSVTWLDSMHLLVGSTDVVDLPKRLILWRYESAATNAKPYGGWQWMVMNSGNILGIVPGKLLHEEVLAASKDLNANEILALKPGAKITLDIQLGGEEQANAEQAVRASLERNGVEIAPDQPLRLSARIVTGRSETQEYGRSRFIDFGDREQVTVTEKLYEVELTIDGQPLWKQTSTLQSGHAPMTVWMKEGESAQQAVDRQNTQWTSNFAYGVALPRYVVHPKYAGPLGTSKITLGGAQ